MDVTARARRSDALYYDVNSLHRRDLCDMIALLEQEKAELEDRLNAECLLQVSTENKLQSSLTPDLRCSSCGYTERYFFWYGLTGFKHRHVRHCPGCGTRILGVAGAEVPDA